MLSAVPVAASSTPVCKLFSPQMIRVWLLPWPKPLGMKNPISNKQIYRNYLQLIRPEAPQAWFDFMLKLEFGSPKKKYQTQSGRTYTPPPLDNKYRPWYEILVLSYLVC